MRARSGLRKRLDRVWCWRLAGPEPVAARLVGTEAIAGLEWIKQVAKVASVQCAVLRRDSRPRLGQGYEKLTNMMALKWVVLMTISEIG